MINKFGKKYSGRNITVMNDRNKVTQTPYPKRIRGIDQELYNQVKGESKRLRMNIGDWLNLAIRNYLRLSRQRKSR